MEERPTFGEVVGFAASGAALGGAATAGLIVLVEAWTSTLAVLLGLFLAMCMGVIAAMFTALPFGILIAWPIFRYVRRSSLSAAAVGLACAALMWWLWFGYEDDYWYDAGWSFRRYSTSLGRCPAGPPTG